MTIELVREALGWCILINYGILLWWFGFYAFAHGWVYRLHTRWFPLSRERFDAIHYAGMAGYKLGIFLLNLAPWLALHLVA